MPNEFENFPTPNPTPTTTPNMNTTQTSIQTSLQNMNPNPSTNPITTTVPQPTRKIIYYWLTKTTDNVEPTMNIQNDNVQKYVFIYAVFLALTMFVLFGSGIVCIILLKERNSKHMIQYIVYVKHKKYTYHSVTFMMMKLCRCLCDHHEKQQQKRNMKFIEHLENSESVDHRFDEGVWDTNHKNKNDQDDVDGNNELDLIDNNIENNDDQVVEAIDNMTTTTGDTKSNHIDDLDMRMNDLHIV